MVKRQFVRITPSQQKEQSRGYTPSANNLSIAGAQPGISSAQPREGLSSPVFPSRRPGTGLLSNWKAGKSLSSPLVENSKAAAMADLETLKRGAVQESVSPPAFNSGTLAGLPLERISPHESGFNSIGNVSELFSGPVSPHQSGIGHLPITFANPQTFQPAAPVQQSPSRPLLPMPGTGPDSQPLAPMFSPSADTTSSLWERSSRASKPLPSMPLRQAQGPGLAEIWVKQKQRKKRRVPIWARLVLCIILLLLVTVEGVGGYYYFTLSSTLKNVTGQKVTRLKGDDDPNVGRNNSSGDILSGGRLNILLLGSDTDQKFNNTYLAQTDIVVTVDPASKTVGMLSIPRDFYINIPGVGMHKLDEAYGYGGVALSRLTIYQDFGIPINYYAWVGLDGFIKVIDTVGGVDVDVLHPITDDNYPDDIGDHGKDIFAVKRLYLAPGPQHLDGPSALEYVRSRHADLIGDFGRSARQQQVLTQLKTKLNNPDIFGKLQEIANDLNGFVKTDMQLTDILRLMNFARNLDQSKINRVILSGQYSNVGTLPDGTSVVFPHCAQIVPVISRMFALGSNARCNIQANSGNSPILASASKPASAWSQGDASGGPYTQPPSDSTWQTASQMATASKMTLQGNRSELFGIRGLLDLLFLVICESPGAMQT
jgi:LCP family protein required for cell wall assembly